MNCEALILWDPKLGVLLVCEARGYFSIGFEFGDRVVAERFQLVLAISGPGDGADLDPKLTTSVTKQKLDDTWQKLGITPRYPEIKAQTHR